MNHTAFFAAVKAGEIGTCYLMEGTEEYIKQQALARLKERILPAGMESMNVTELINPETDTLIAAAETLPFLGDKRLVVVRDCDLLTAGRKQENEDKAQAILEYLPRASPSTCLVFVIKGKADGRKKLYTYLKKKDAIVDFSPMTDGECVTWIQRTLRSRGKQIDTRTAELLVFTVGRDAAMLRQEMDKLANYAGDRVLLESSDIEAVCTQSLECTVFQMVDAQVAGRYREAFDLLSRMVRAGEDRMMVLSMLLRQYRILFHMRCLMEEGTPKTSYATLLGIPPFAVERTQSQARRYNRESLRTAYDALVNMEQEIKAGKISQEGCAEMAMLQLNGILG